MLGVVFSVLHFKHFMYSRQVHIITDHKPLITLFAKNLATTSPRLLFLKHKHECAEDIRSFYDYRESLTIIDGMVLKDKRIVIPADLCEQALENLCRSHMGMVKTKERAVLVCFG